MKEHIDSISYELNRSKTTANMLMSEHRDYLLVYSIPRLNSDIKNLTKALVGVEELATLKSNNIKAKIVIQAVNQLQESLSGFKRFVSVFDGDRENSFSKYIVKIDASMIEIVKPLKQAGLSLDIGRSTDIPRGRGR